MVSMCQRLEGEYLTKTQSERHTKTKCYSVPVFCCHIYKDRQVNTENDNIAINQDSST